MEKIIRVTGKGKLSVKPDTIRLMLTLEDARKKLWGYIGTVFGAGGVAKMLGNAFKKSSNLLAAAMYYSLKMVMGHAKECLWSGGY